MTAMRNKVGAGSLWIIVGRAAVNLLNLLSMIVLARLLVPADFGIVATGTAIMTVFQAVTDMSVAQALIRLNDPTDDHLNSAWTLNILRGALVGLALASTADLVADFFGDARLEQVMWFFGLSVILTGFANPRPALLQKKLVFRQDFILNVTSKFVTFVATVAIAIAYKSYWAILIGTLVGQIVFVVVSYFIMPFRPRLSLVSFRDLLGFSVWLTLSQVVNNLNWRLDTLLVSKFLGAATLGLYTVGNQLSSMPTREATQPLIKTLFPAFSRIREEPARLRQAYQRAQTLMTAVALPLGVGMAMIGDLLILLFLGSKWMPALIVVQVIAIVSAMQSLATLAQGLAMATGDTRLIFVRSTQMIVVRMPFTVAGLYFGGLQGLVLARALTASFGILTNCFIVRKLINLGVRKQLRANLMTIASVGVMALFVTAVKHELPSVSGRFALIVETALCVLTGGVSYFGTLFGLWYLRGRPKGPEQEIQSIFMELRERAVRVLSRSKERAA